MPTFEISDSSNIKLGETVQRCKSSDLSLSVISESDLAQQIPFKAKLCQDTQVIASSDGEFVLHWQSQKFSPGNYSVEIEPKSEKTFSDYKKLNYGTDFNVDITLQANETKQITAKISRKESILYDIKYAFYVLDNEHVEGSAPIYELDFFSMVSENSSYIAQSSRKFGVSQRLIKSIMYMETTHGYYDEPLDWFDRNKSIRPMNVNVAYWSRLFTREELYDKQKNVHAGTFLLKRILDRIPSEEISKIATLYNNINAVTVNNYGARIKNIYDEYLYIPPPSFFEQINEQFEQFERLSPLEQYDILRRMFGG